MADNTKNSSMTRVQSADQGSKESRRLAYRLWHYDFTGAVQLNNFRPKYAVTGRRRNGSVKGFHSIRWLLGRILIPIWTITLTIIALFLDGFGTPFFRAGWVRGPRDCLALAFADVNHADFAGLPSDPIWLLMSRDRALLCKPGPPDTVPQLIILWHAEGPAKPNIDTYRNILTWPDGSTITQHR